MGIRVLPASISLAQLCAILLRDQEKAHGEALLHGLVSRVIDIAKTKSERDVRPAVNAMNTAIQTYQSPEEGDEMIKLFA